MDTSKPHLNNDHGFVRRPYAIQKVVTGPDGTLQTIFVDARTGAPVKNPRGYQIVTAKTEGSHRKSKAIQSP